LNGTILRPLLGCFALLALLSPSARAVTIATVPVGSPGNAPDPATGHGAVAYNYRIATYDVTFAQYVEFLNAKASAADPYGLWNPNLGLIGGQWISRSGTGPYSYTAGSGYGNKPMALVSWYSAVRFVNWLTNGQGSGDTESGSYAITAGGNNSGMVVVPSAAQRAAWSASSSIHWLVPSENEWYKAAYYNPAGAAYYTYPFQSNSLPAALAPPGNSNSGDFNDAARFSDATGSDASDVGAYPNSLSPFGCLDMGGDVFQWNDLDVFGDGSSRQTRGGDWASFPSDSASSFSVATPAAAIQYTAVGFRVASVGGVPEPASIVLASLGLVGLLKFGKRFRDEFAANRRASGGRW
jgi:formylglycine-generating enzyme required for sulfatase activity